MAIFTRIAALSIVTLATACGDPQDDTHWQEQVIAGFYQQHLKTQSSGIPAAEELKQLQPFLSQALFKLLAHAATAEAQYHTATEEPVPPLVDGDLFTSRLAGASAFQIDSCTSEIKRASCLVRFWHTTKTTNDDDNESWQDKLLLVREKQQWRIDDIAFLGNSASSQGEYLTDILNSIGKDYP